MADISNNPMTGVPSTAADNGGDNKPQPAAGDDSKFQQEMLGALSEAMNGGEKDDATEK
ncbi:MAG: hypothetical protein WED00_13515 [Aquisalimonadaceae bacterium]